MLTGRSNSTAFLSREPSIATKHRLHNLNQRIPSVFRRFLISRIRLFLLLIPALVFLLYIQRAQPSFDNTHVNPNTYKLQPAGDPKKRAKLPNAPFVPPPTWEQYYEKFTEPDYGLLSNKPPSQQPSCDQNGPLLFIGIFTTAGAAGKRQIQRTLTKTDFAAVKGHDIEIHFISAEPPNDDWKYLLEQENEIFNDITILEGVGEAIDEGKTMAYLKWVAEKRKGRRPKFVMKMDDDTFFVVPNVIRSFAELEKNCSNNIYWGTTAGAHEGLGPYMRGLAYGMSWPLASWIGTADISAEHSTGIEDARIGRFISTLPAEEPVKWVDHGWKLGDWDQLEVTVDTVGFHWLKLDHWIPMVKRKALKAFSDAGRPYRWDWDKDAGH